MRFFGDGSGGGRGDGRRDGSGDGPDEEPGDNESSRPGRPSSGSMNSEDTEFPKHPAFPQHPALRECLERWNFSPDVPPVDPGHWRHFLDDLEHAFYSISEHGGIILDKNFDQIVTHAVDGFIVHDIRGKVLAFNQAACDMLGYSREEFKALHVYDFELHIEPGAFWSTMSVDEVFTVEGVHQRKNGSTYPVETRVGAFMLDGRKVCLAICRDITQRKSHEAALKMMNANLSAANEATRRATLLHQQAVARLNFELRTPLSALLGYTELMIEEMLEDMSASLEAAENGHQRAHPGDHKKIREQYLPDLYKIRSAGMELASWLDKLADTGALERQIAQVHIQEFPLARLIDDIKTTVRPLAERRDNRLVVELENDCQRALITSDLTKVRQILLNLLENACRVTERGEVKLRAGCMTVPERGGRKDIVFEVHDTGPGMGAQELAGFLAPDPADGSERTHMGMGLTLTRHLCELLGGSLQVTSQPGVGTIFLVTLPISGGTLGYATRS